VAIIDRLADTQGQEGTEWYNEFQRLLYRKFRKRIWRAIQNEAQDAVGEVLDQDPEAIMEQFQHGEAMVGRYSVLDQETGQAIGILASATVCISSSGEVSGSDGLVAPECDGERVQVMTYHSVQVRPQQWRDEEGGEIRRGRVSKESRAAAAVWQQAEGGEKRVVGEDIGDVLRGL
ncbi:MAG: hypothetical protein AAFX99_27015, partial [Myxococcota bacterium]